MEPEYDARFDSTKGTLTVEKRAVSESPSVTGYEALLDFAKWCVNNWVCDGWDDAIGYTEEFCNCPDCRRCSARRVLEKVAS